MTAELFANKFSGDSSQCRATMEGEGEFGYLWVVGKQLLGNGRQSRTTLEGLFKVSDFWIMNKQSFGDGD